MGWEEKVNRNVDKTGEMTQKVMENAPARARDHTDLCTSTLLPADGTAAF